MPIKILLKNIFIKLPFVRIVSCYLTSKIPRVLMYHRFVKSTGLGVTGSSFEWHLNIIRRYFKTMQLCEYIDKRRNGIIPHSTVIITVDDGYFDFYETAYPLLLKKKFQQHFS